MNLFGVKVREAVRASGVGCSSLIGMGFLGEATARIFRLNEYLKRPRGLGPARRRKGSAFYGRGCGTGPEAGIHLMAQIILVDSHRFVYLGCWSTPGGSATKDAGLAGPSFLRPSTLTGSFYQSAPGVRRAYDLDDTRI